MLISLAVAQTLIYIDLGEESTELFPFYKAVHFVDLIQFPAISIFKWSLSPLKPCSLPALYCIYVAILKQVRSTARKNYSYYTVVRARASPTSWQPSIAGDLFSEFSRESWELNYTTYSIQQSSSEGKDRLQVWFKYANRTKPDI